MPIDEARVTQLEALGYFCAGNAPRRDDPDTVKPDPKDRVDLFKEYQRAKSLTATNSLDAALKMIQQVAEKDLENPRFFLEVGDLQLRRGNYSEAKNHLDKALAEFELILKNDSGYFLARFQSGLIAIMQKD